MMSEMNVWNPHTQEIVEFSVSQFWMVAGTNGVDLNAIEAGTMVYIISSSSFLLGAC